MVCNQNRLEYKNQMLTNYYLFQESQKSVSELIKKPVFLSK